MSRDPGVTVSIGRTTAQVAHQRLLQDLKNGIPSCDVFSSTDTGHDVTLASGGKLARYVSESARSPAPGFAALGPGGMFSQIYPKSSCLSTTSKR